MVEEEEEMGVEKREDCLRVLHEQDYLPHFLQQALLLTNFIKTKLQTPMSQVVRARKLKL